MSTRDDGGPAFPHHDAGDTGTRSGMSLRDYFAAAALQGYLASWPENGANVVNHAQAIASSCYVLADAMLAERAKP